MLLITMQEWFGPGRHIHGMERDSLRQEIKSTIQGFVTQLSLGEAIEKIHRSAEVFESQSRNRYGLTYKLISVTTIDVLTSDQISMAGLRSVEDGCL